jgi:hypothetical protein
MGDSVPYFNALDQFLAFPEPAKRLVRLAELR